jgi:hypothetical protein
MKKRNPDFGGPVQGSTASILDAAIATHSYGFTLVGRKPLSSPLPPARVHLFDEES